MTLTLRPHQTKAVKAMLRNTKGQIIVPTGGGKTMCMIDDAITEFNRSSMPKTIVVVAPRILLANQLSAEFLQHITDVDVIHVHSGETHHNSTTKTDQLEYWYHNSTENILIFTTYHSLHKIQESDIDVDTIYFDEAHNACGKSFSAGVVFFGVYSPRAYFFTATPKHSTNKHKLGMNNTNIFGEVICNIPAPELVDNGYILPPKVQVMQLDKRDKDKSDRHFYEEDADIILSHLDKQCVNKLLVCARKTSQIVNIVSQSKLITELYARGYNWMYITAKTGAVINGHKVNRETFFKTLNKWGTNNTKFVVIHHSILSEGINVSGLESALFLRNMNYIDISQTIGRVIRKGKPEKVFGLICVPVYDKVGITTAKKVTTVVDTIFHKGEPAISTVKR